SAITTVISEAITDGWRNSSASISSGHFLRSGVFDGAASLICVQARTNASTPAKNWSHGCFVAVVPTCPLRSLAMEIVTRALQCPFDGREFGLHVANAAALHFCLVLIWSQRLDEAHDEMQTIRGVPPRFELPL